MTGKIDHVVIIVKESGRSHAGGGAKSAAG